jgi:hypothetical protein
MDIDLAAPVIAALPSGADVEPIAEDQLPPDASPKVQRAFTRIVGNLRQQVRALKESGHDFSVPKARLDQVLDQKKQLKGELEQALRLVERQSELITALEARNQKLVASLARLVESRRVKEQDVRI